jgi:hypothetical protein
MVPPGGVWKFNNPPTITGSTYDELVNKVIAFRRSNGATDEQLATIEFEIEDQICAHWPKGCQRGTLSSMTILEAQREFKKALQSIAADGFVSQEEAERRAHICLSCHNHVKNANYTAPSQGGCKGCSKASQVLDATLWKLGLKAVEMVSPLLLMGKSTTLDGQLGQCGLCGCLLKLKVWIKNGVGGFAGKENMWPSFCFMKDK